MNCITIFFTEVLVGENLIGVETESYLHEKCSLSDDYCFSKEKKIIYLIILKKIRYKNACRNYRMHQSKLCT